MRIEQHLTVILLVAVLGAIGLAATVGVLLGGLESAALAYGEAASRQNAVELLEAEARSLSDTAGRITMRSSEEAYTVIDRAIKRSGLLLGNLAPSPSLPASMLDDARLALQRTQRLAASRSTGVQHPDDLAELQAASRAYAAALGGLNAQVAEGVTQHGRSLARRRRIIMLVIGVICFAYLAIIERMRQWTTRHLIDPMQKIAEAARQAMRGGPAPALEHAKTEELSTLVHMLDSFSDTIQANVSERTAQLARQQEVLEQEVRVRRHAEHALRFSALRDKLTGLCNRDLLLDRIGRCLHRRATRDDFEFALLYIDLDQFGTVNDAHGQAVGDQTVIAVAERLHAGLDEAARAAGVECTTLARLGGDEFAVLLDGLKDRAHATLVAERLHEVLARPLRVQQRDVAVSASVGVAFRDGADTPDAALRNAEAAMHYARVAGQGKTSVFNRDMQTHVAERHERRERMRQALQHGEFTLAYQPIVSLKTGKLVGFEALARWNDSQRGPVSPVEFIEEAERHGGIIDLGRWVIEEACHQLQRWQRIATVEPVSVSVNVSRQQLVQPGLLEVIHNALRTTGVDAPLLKLEITESVIMDNPDAVAEVLRELKTLGVEIHMDDFGTGYSSLSYLHRLPIDVLKIDRAFMNAMSADHDYADIVHTVVALARTLHMRVTVEGVEAPEQLEQIRALDCDFAQGYLFAKPVNAAAATRMIQSPPAWLRPAA